MKEYNVTFARDNIFELVKRVCEEADPLLIVCKKKLKVILLPRYYWRTTYMSLRKQIFPSKGKDLKSYPISSARRNWRELLAGINEGGEDEAVIVTSNKGDAILMSSQGFFNVEETIYALCMPNLSFNILDEKIKRFSRSDFLEILDFSTLQHNNLEDGEACKYKIMFAEKAMNDARMIQAVAQLQVYSRLIERIKSLIPLMGNAPEKLIEAKTAQLCGSLAGFFAYRLGRINRIIYTIDSQTKLVTVMSLLNVTDSGSIGYLPKDIFAYATRKAMEEGLSRREPVSANEVISNIVREKMLAEEKEKFPSFREVNDWMTNE